MGELSSWRADRRILAMASHGREIELGEPSGASSASHKDINTIVGAPPL